MFIRETRHGFTLIELCIAVIIFCIIVVTVVASFLRAQQKAIGAMALSNLDHIRSAQLLYHIDNQLFTSDTAALQAHVPFTIDDGEWNYTFQTVSMSSFDAVATRKNNKPHAGFTITLSVTAGAPGSSITYAGGATSYPP